MYFLLPSTYSALLLLVVIEVLFRISLIAS